MEKKVHLTKSKIMKKQLVLDRVLPRLNIYFSPIDEDWNEIDPKIIHYQIKKIFMVMKKSKVQVPDVDTNANLKNIENFIESFVQIKNGSTNTSKFSSEQLTWAENALGEQGTVGQKIKKSPGQKKKS